MPRSRQTDTILANRASPPHVIRPLSCCPSVIAVTFILLSAFSFFVLLCFCFCFVLIVQADTSSFLFDLIFKNLNLRIFRQEPYLFSPNYFYCSKFWDVLECSRMFWNVPWPRSMFRVPYSMFHISCSRFSLQIPHAFMHAIRRKRVGSPRAGITSRPARASALGYTCFMSNQGTC